MNSNYERVLEICDEFLQVPSTVGFETPFLDYLEKRITSLGYETQRTSSYLAVNPHSNHSKYLFSTHIDRQGFIKDEKGDVVYATNHIKTKEGISFKRKEIAKEENTLFEKLKNSPHYEITTNDDFLVFKDESFGSVKFFRQDDPGSLEKVALRYVGDKIYGYTKEGKINESGILSRFDLHYKTRKISYDCSNTLTSDIFALQSSITRKNNYFYAQLDNVISAAVLFYFLENTHMKDEIIFTTKEEVGMSYKCVLEYLEKRNDLQIIVMDTSPYPDFEEKKEGFLTLRYGDERNGFDRELVENIQTILKSKKISYDMKPSFMGRTELGLIARESRGNLKGTTIQIPTLNYHTTYETATIEGLENYVEIIKTLINSQ